MTENTWLLLGFDARYTKQDLQKVPWTRETREIFLLNPDTENPLTVDQHIWPSRFSYYPELAALLKQPKHNKIEAHPSK